MRILAATYVLALAAVALAGCTEDEIVRYQIPKQDQIDKLNPGASAETPDRHPVLPGGEPARTLAAIVPHGSRGWFFKLTGPPDAVGRQRDKFQAFLESLRFEGQADPPQWTLPEGWSAQPGSGMRYATLLIEDSRPPLELSVTSLGGPESGQERDYLLNNINRWRGQLGLAEIAADDLGGETTTVSCEGAVATVVDMIGTAAATGGSTGPPFAAAGGGLPPIGSASDPSTELLTAPEGWRPGRAGGMRRAAFDVVDGRQHVEITVIGLAKAGVNLLDQVNRWRGQVGLPEITSDELATQVERLPVGDLEARYVEAIGPEQAVLAAVVEVGDTEWFFKLLGDAELARRERERFRQFVQSADMAALANEQ